MQFHGVKAIVALPQSDAGPGTTLRLTAESSSQAGSDFSETLKLTFNRDVNFLSYPSFLLDVPQGVNTDSPFQLDFFDGVATVPLHKIDPAPAQALVYSGRLTFIGGFFTPFKAKANQTYSASLFSGLTGIATFGSSENARTVDLAATSGVAGYVYSDVPDTENKPNPVTYPATPGVSTALDIPATNSGFVGMSITTSEKIPAGIPPVSGVGIIPMPYYMNVRLGNGLALDRPITATFVLPMISTFYYEQFDLAIWDTASGGWRLSIADLAARQGDLLRLTIRRSEMKQLRPSRRYVIALYATRSSAPYNVANQSVRPHILAVLGDSISVLTILPQSPVILPSGSCASGWPQPTNCEYTVDSTLSYPGVTAQVSGARLLNFARPDNGETTVGKNSWLVNQVPYIPADTDVVVFEGGRADMIYEPTTDTSPRVAIMVKAILERAPHAKIVFLAPLCIGGPVADAWISIERKLAPQYGAFVDSSSVSPCNDILQHTDGLHATPVGNRVIGTAVAAAVNSLLANRVTK